LSLETRPPPAEPPRQSLARLFSPTIVGTLRAGYGFERLRSDVFGGVTAAVVALPLALAFGVASGAGPIAGLYGAIAVGFFASIFGGTPSQVSGPTGPMTVVMAAVIASHATSLAEAFTVVIIGGLIQIVFGLMRVGKYIAYTPYSVVSGFMTGIGVIIMLIQVLPFIGLPTSTQGVLGTLETLSKPQALSVDVATLALAAACLAILLVWPRMLQKLIPAPLAVLVIGTLTAMFFIGGTPVIGEVPSGLPTPITPTLSVEAWPQLLQGGFILALLGSIDTLLTSLVADSITRTQHDSDKELVGQGIGNCIAGLIGGLPGAGATMRTVVNIRAGGRTPVSGAVHSLLLLGLALGLGPVVSTVPHAVLAAILMKVGWDIIDWGYLKRARRAPREKFAIMLVTFALTVLVDLITAVGVGIILASFVNSRWLAREQLKGVAQTAGGDDADRFSDEEKALLKATNGRVLVTVLRGSFSYASARELVRRASPTVSGVDVAVYDFSQVGYVDTSAALAIEEIVTEAQAQGMRVLVAGIAGEARDTLDDLRVLQRLPVENVFKERRDAIAAAAAFCDRTPGTSTDRLASA
jgi:sulfate permease, SulP family